jgi:cytochrome c nitrite reductase small subunit
MNSYYAGWAYSSHRGAASCNDCHVPHENVARKIAFKMSDGARHSFVFTFHLEPQTIRLTEAATSVVQTNCFRCHEHQIMATSMSTALTSPDSETTCFSCHRETPHGLAQSLSSSPDVRLPRVPSAGMPPPDARPAGVPDGPHGK